MNPLLEHILAAMIATISPGMSNYSQVPVERCDEVCRTTPRCENEHDFRCKPPMLNMSLYEQRQKELMAQGRTRQEAINEAFELSHTRPETYEEGMARYYVIGSAAINVAKKNSYGACLAENECMNKTTEHTGEGSLQACHLECSKTRKWQRKWQELAWALSVVSSFESGWRSDVQAGTGLMGRGDCKVWWLTETIDGQDVRRKVKAWTDGAFPDRSTCRSFGLNQMWFGTPPKVLSSFNESGITYDKVLGLDLTTTERTFDLAARYLVTARRYCRGSENNWAWAMFSLYGSGSSCETKTGKLRAGRYWKWSYPSNLRPLAPRHKQALESDKAQEIVRFLESATSPVLWLPAEKTKSKSEGERVASL